MRHSPRKRFGQNFLQNVHIINEIVQAIHPAADDNLLEIGPGLGALTLPLLQRVNALTAIEIDRDLHAYLLGLPATQNKLQLISADALTVNYNQFGSSIRLVGNLPYNISTPLLIHLLDYTASIQDMHFMLQKEVVERMSAVPGNKDYGRLSVILQYFFEVDHLFDVPPEAFNPPPKVDSAIVRLVPHAVSPYAAVAKKDLEQLVAISFAMRRKTLNNNLKGVVSAAQLEQLDIDGSKRPEQISIEEYVRLAQFVAK